MECKSEKNTQHERLVLNFFGTQNSLQFVPNQFFIPLNSTSLVIALDVSWFFLLFNLQRCSNSVEVTRWIPTIPILWNSVRPSNRAMIHLWLIRFDSIMLLRTTDTRINVCHGSILSLWKMIPKWEHQSRSLQKPSCLVQLLVSVSNCFVIRFERSIIFAKKTTMAYTEHQWTASTFASISIWRNNLCKTSIDVVKDDDSSDFSLDSHDNNFPTSPSRRCIAPAEASNTGPCDCPGKDPCRSPMYK